MDNCNIRIEANERTVEALKRNLEAIEISANGEDEAKNGLETSLKTLDKMANGERNIANSRIKTDHESNLSSDKIITNFIREVEKSKEACIGIQKCSLTKRDDVKIIEDNKTLKVNETKTVEIEERCSGYNEIENGEKRFLVNVQSIDDEEERFSETWNTIYCDDDTGDEENAETKLKWTKEMDELIKKKFLESQMKWSPPDEFPGKSANDIVDAYSNIGMDNPLNAILFSEQLIEYVLNKLGYVWPCTGGARSMPRSFISTRFSKVIGEAVLAIIDSNIERIADSYKQLMEKNVHTIRYFRIEVCTTAAFFFCEGYGHDKFLMYAAQLAGLSAFYFASGDPRIADVSAQVLAYILNYYIFQLMFSPSYDWFSLHLEAQEMRRKIRSGRIIFVRPTGNP